MGEGTNQQPESDKDLQADGEALDDKIRREIAMTLSLSFLSFNGDVNLVLAKT